MLRWGDPTNQKLFEAIYKDTGQHHPAFLRKPTLRSDCIRYYDAYRSLGVSRSWSQVGPLPIQVKDVEAYLNLAEIEGSATRLKYLRLIQRMDAVELKFLHEQARKKWND